MIQLQCKFLFYFTFCIKKNSKKVIFFISKFINAGLILKIAQRTLSTVQATKAGRGSPLITKKFSPSRLQKEANGAAQPITITTNDPKRQERASERARERDRDLLLQILGFGLVRSGQVSERQKNVKDETLVLQFLSITSTISSAVFRINSFRFRKIFLKNGEFDFVYGDDCV